MLKALIPNSAQNYSLFFPEYENSHSSTINIPSARPEMHENTDQNESTSDRKQEFEECNTHWWSERVRE